MDCGMSNTNKLVWIKSGKEWHGIYGQFRAKVSAPVAPMFMHHWSVWVGVRSGGSGGTSSVIASKRAAENEVVRFAEVLRKERHP